MTRPLELRIKLHVLGLMFGVFAVAEAAMGQGVGDHSSYATFSIEGSHPAAVVFRLEGPISAAMADETRDALSVLNSLPERPILIVFLGSGGGDAYAAMQIGEALRAANAHIFVTSSCDSACIFVLASGIFRSASAFTVGVHRARARVNSQHASPSAQGPNLAADVLDAAMDRFETEAEAYFERMGVDPGILGLMQSVDSLNVRRLDDRQLIDLRILGMDRGYFADHIHELRLDARSGFDPESIASQIRSMNSQCGVHFSSSDDFARCFLPRLFRDM